MSNIVVKDNDLIRNARYSLSEKEQKIIVYLISLLDSQNDNEIKTLVIDIGEFCDVCGISHNSNNYEYIRRTIKELKDKSKWVSLENGNELLFSWIDYALILRNKGQIEIKLSDSLKPFLLNLKQNFTEYQLINVLALKGKYSPRLYELLKSWLYRGDYETTVEDLKDWLMIGEQVSFSDFRIFKSRVVMASVKEINSVTDLDIEVITLYKGRKASGFKFIIKEKSGVEKVFDMMDERKKRLGRCF